MSKILKVSVPGIVLFVIYLCLWKVAESYFYIGVYNDYYFCFSMSAVVTPIYYFVCLKLVGNDLKKEIYFIVQTVVFLHAAVLYGFLCAIGPQRGHADFSMDFEFIAGPIRFMYMYFIGSSVYVLIYHVIAAIRERKYWDILGKSVSAVLVFGLYCFLSEKILPDIGGIFVLIILTVICHRICKSILRVRYEKFSGYIFEMSVLVFGLFVRNVIYFIYVPKLCYETSDFIRILIIYAFANGINYAIDSGIKDSQKSGSSGKVQYEQYEKKDIQDEPKSQKQRALRNTVLENMKRLLMESQKDFLLIDEEYHFQAGKGDYHPDLLLYHMKLKCHVAVDLKLDDFKPEYLSRMNTYLETLDRDVKKTEDNPSAGLILCKNADTEIVEYSFNKGLSKEMTDEYETNLMDKEILKEKLNELYDRLKETNPDSDT